MKMFLTVLGILLLSSRLWALTADMDRIDSGKKYSAIVDSAAILYVDRCERGKFTAYEWKTWEGYYSVRAFVEPIAVIKVQREPNEFFGGNLNPFIHKARSETGKIGGNAFCFVQMKQNKRLLEPEVMIFRAYKQLFQAGNPAWESFFGEVMNRGTLLTQDDIKTGEKTNDIFEKQQPATKAKPNY